MTETIEKLDKNLAQICKIKRSTRKIGFSSNEFNEIMYSGEDFETSLKQKINEKLTKDLEGRCIGDGYVLNNSLKIIDRSKLYFPKEALQLFYTLNVVYEYVICNPNPGVKLECNAVSKSKIGIVARLSSSLSPLVILVPNDLCEVPLGDIDIDDNHIVVEVIGKKFEQNDKKITVIAKFSHSGYL